jgi:tetratricopeptide (TPR) repeat protein
MAGIEAGLGFLVAPLFTMGAAFGVLAMGGGHHHHLGTVQVTQTMVWDGMTSDVADHALSTALKHYYYRVDDHFESPLLPLIQESTTDVAAEMLHVDKLVLTFRRLQGLVGSEYEVAFVEDDVGQQVLHLTEVEGDDMLVKRWHWPVEDGDYEAAIEDAARQLVTEIDPTLVALDDLRTGNLIDAAGMIELCRERCAYAQMATNDLLSGILAARRNDLDAAEMSFRAAHLRQPDLDAATIGLAVVDALRGNRDAAVARLANASELRQVLVSWTDLRRATMMRTAEGQLHATDGEPSRALAAFSDALRLDESYSPLHYKVAEFYSRLSFEGPAAFHRRRAEQLRGSRSASTDIVAGMLLDLLG